MKDSFNFNKWIESAMLSVTKKTLATVEKLQNTGKHCFYITFITSNPNVKIPTFLREKYPHEVTIVLEHQFTNFKLINNGFSVNLFFSGQQYEIFCPLNSIINFYDKYTNLQLTFTDTSLVESITKLPHKTASNSKGKNTKVDSQSVSEKNKVTDNIIPFKPSK